MLIIFSLNTACNGLMYSTEAAVEEPAARYYHVSVGKVLLLTDIFYGTLRSDHIELALAAFEAERARPEFGDGVPWIVTGHSLGGALATEISVRYPEVRAYMFNTSPFYRSDGMTNDIRRTVFNERGEILRRFARFDEAPAAEAFTLNCGPRESTFAKHKIHGRFENPSTRSMDDLKIQARDRLRQAQDPWNI